MFKEIFLIIICIGAGLFLWTLIQNNWNLTETITQATTLIGSITENPDASILSALGGAASVGTISKLAYDSFKNKAKETIHYELSPKVYQQFIIYQVFSAHQ